MEKTLLELAKEIELFPERAQKLLSSFEGNTPEEAAFAKSLTNLPAYAITPLLHTFSQYSSPNSIPTKLSDLMKKQSHIGSIFVLVEDNTDWTYQGISASGKPLCRPFNSQHLLELDKDAKIKYVF